MRFGIDLDGVLADFGSRTIKITNNIWPGKIPLDFQPKDYEYTEVLTKDEWDIVWDKIKKIEYFWEDEKALPGLVELQETIKPTDEVFFVTARAITVGRSPLVQSCEWLGHRKLYPRSGRSVVLPVGKAQFKQDLFRGLDIKFMLDDYGPTVQQLNQIDDMHAFVLDCPWNREYTDLPRVYSVSEYMKTIRLLEAKA